MSQPTDSNAADGVVDAANRSVRFVRTYPSSKKDVWDAVTDPDRLSRWLGNVTGALHIGGRYRVDFGDGDIATGEVVTCREPDRLVVTWEFPDEGTTWVDVELADADTGTRFVLTHSGLRPSDLAQYGAGWHTFFDHLDATLRGDQPSGWWDGYHERFPRYRNQVNSDVPQNS